MASGCLYEEGPFFSFNSPEYRIAYRWKFDKITFNGLDVTLANNPDSINYGTSYISFDTTKRFSFLINSLKTGRKGNFVYTGNWALEDQKRELRIVYDAQNPNSGVPTQPNRLFRIIKLNEDDLRLRYTAGDNTTLFYLKPKK